MRPRPSRRRHRALRRVAALLPAPVLRRWSGVAGWAARFGGRSRHASDTLRRTLQVILDPGSLPPPDDGATLSAAEIAGRLGLDDEQVERWAGWALLGRPAAAGPPPRYPARVGLERARLLVYLDRHGVGEQELRDAAAEDRLPLLIVDRVLTGRLSCTAEQVARRAGVSVPFAAEVWRALGMPLAGPEERLYTRRDIEAMRLIGALRTVFSEEDLLDAVAVIGRGMAQIAAGEVELFRRAVAVRFAEQRLGEMEAALRSAALVDLLVGPSRILLDVAHRRQLEAAARAVSAVHIEEATGRLPGEQEAAVGFADLVGFTAASERLSAVELGALSSRLLRTAEQVFPERRTRIVKSIGDAVMFTARTAVDACSASVALLDAAEDAGLPPLHVGLAYGPVLARHADLFGRTVNLAARLSAAAPARTVLLAWPRRGDGDAVEQLRRELQAAGMRPGRPRTLSLRGLGRPVQAVAVRAAGAPAAAAPAGGGERG